MSVKKESSGRRSVQVEVEVPGTPEEVWRAISTGPGISSWFVPTEMEEKLGGEMKLHFGPGMDSVAKITAWQPPVRFAAESHWGENAPAIATEWFVESRSGGTCIVRVVHSLFTDTDDWDDQLEGTEKGWPVYFRVLRFYLENFQGMQSNSMIAVAMSPNSESETWRKLTESLAISGKTIGAKIQTKEAPPLSGKIEWIKEEPHSMMSRLDSPAPGIGLLGADACMGGVIVSLSLYLFGDQSKVQVTAQESAWQERLNALFPAPVMPGETH